MKTAPYLVAIFIFLFVYSCSDNSVKNSKTKYLKGDVGSYWIYENIPVDENYVRETDSSYVDSTFISEKLVILEKECDVYTTHDFEDGFIDDSSTMYLREEDEKIYTHSGFVTSAFDELPIELPFEIEEEWIKIADFNDDLWLVYDFEVDTVKIPFVNASMFGDLTVMGNRSVLEELEIGGKTVLAQKFELELVFDGTIILGGMPIDFSPERSMDIWMAENIGLVKSFEHPSEITMPYLGTLNIKGSERILTKYKIK